MPLLGKIVVIKRHGGDGTEFPLTASCLFGRKLDCDIRIQLPQVSKEHCKIELNENKELIVTNLSSVNPTRINGQVLNQSERLKHGDLITIIDRSFRFEYPPPKTPKKKRLSTAGKDKTVQALQDQQEKSTHVPVEKRKSEHSYDTCLKDGSNLPPSVQQTVEADPEDGKRKDNMSPFGQLYQMVKQDLVAKSPWKSDVPKTPLARPQTDQEDVSAADVKSTSKQVTTPSTKKRRSSKSHSEDATKPATPQKSCNANLEEKPADDDWSITPSLTEKSATPVPQRKRTPSKTPQKFSAGEVVQQILLEPHSEGKTPKSPKERRSGASQDQSLAFQKPSGQPQTPGSTSKNTEAKMSPRTSPRSNAGKRFQVQEVVDEIKATTSASKKKAGTSVDKPQDGKESHTKGTASKRKRVSFGGQLSPELFDKRLPPNSPLRRGATPRHSLGPFQKPQSLLRRASTIGLLALRLEEAVPEAQKKASPKRAASFVKTPSPAKRSPNTKAKTPSPKSQKSPSAPTNASKPSSPATPKTTRRASTSAIETPKVQGRFSISRISTPSPVQEQVEKPEVPSATAEDIPQKCVTPKIPLKRKSMKVSARKTPKSAIKSAFDVMRSRRSGASCANLKVLTSWADIVKFGQTKPQIEVTTKKKSAKNIVVKKTAVPKLKTPIRRLKDDFSTGHAASPLTIVVGKAHMRANQPVGAAPKIMPNVTLFKKDMKMDEDFTGVADIFKTPANRKSKNIILMNNECPEVPVDEISVMKTPEESGEMIVSPLSVVSTAKCGRYNNEAVTRLLLDNQDDSLLEDESLAQLRDNSNEAVGHDITDQEIPPVYQTEEEEAVPETPVETPKQKTAPSLCLTGVKRLMKTPKQRAEPIEDLRGKLLKTPKDKKPPQEENLEGIKELLKTPKCEKAQVEDIVGVKRVIQTQNEKSSPLLCAGGLQGLMKTPKEKSVENEDLTDVKELMKTPKLKGDLVENQFGLKRLVKTPKQKKQPVEEDLTGVRHLMKTPKHKGERVEDQMGVKRLMQTPKEKVKLVEDLTGVKQLMQTPKQKGEPVSKQFGISKMMKTPRFRGVMAEEDFTGLKELVEDPENNSTPTAEKSVTVPFEIQEPVLAMESDSAFIPAEDLNEECDKENVCPVETKEADILTPVDLQCTSEAADSNQSDLEIESLIPQEKQPEQIEEKSILVEAIDYSSRKDENIIVQSEESVCTPETDTTVKTTPTSSTAEQEEDHFIIKYDNEMAKAPAALSLIEEESMNGPLPSSPLRGRRGKKVLEVPEVTASPVRKSARGRIPKRTDADDEASQMSTDSMKTKISDCLPVVTKTRKGRKAKVDLSSGDPHCPDATEEPAQTPVVKSGMNETENKTSKNDAPIEPAHDVNAGVPQCPSAPTGEEPVQPPVVRSGRRKKIDKPESKTSEDDATVEPIHDVNAGVPQGPGAPTAEEPVQAPVVRSGRRKKMDKTESKTSEDDATVEPIHDVNAGIPQCPDAPAADEPIQAPVVRSGRRKKVDKTESKTSENDASIEPDHDINAGVPQCTDAPAKEELVQATVVKPGRRKKMVKSESQPSEELEQKTSDMICEENAVVPDVKMQTSQGTESISSTRARRGKPSKKEHLKTEPSQILESETPVVVVAEKPATSVLKSGRGRNSKQETIKDQSLDDVVSAETAVEANVEHKEPQTPVVKSGRGRKAKQQKPQLAEVIVDQPAVDTSTHLPVTEEYTETVVKLLRGNRKTKQSKVTVSTEVEENVVAETPVVKSGRKRAVISQETEAEGSVKRSRRAVAVPARPVSVVSSRGRKAESEVAEDVASSEKPVKPVKNTRRTAKVPALKKEENLTTQAGSEFVSAENTAVVTMEKVERGSRAKKQKNSTKDIPVNESSTDEEVGKVKPSKAVNWNPDLVASQILEPSADVEEIQNPQLKKSKRLEKLPAETSTRESNQSTDLPPRGRRGRGAAKQEKELPVEDTQEEAQINVKPLRRGKAVVSAAPKSQPGDNKPSTPLKRKRNEVLEVAEPVKEPLPKRRGRVANGSEAAEEVPSKDKIPEAEPEKVNPKRTGRGQKKTAQEPDPVPAQEPVSGTTTRKGRGVKKVEEVDVPAEAAPVRRTRRK